MSGRPLREERWNRRPVLAATVRTLVFIVPLAFALGLAVLLGRLLPAASSTAILVCWWLGVAAVSFAVLLVIERLARRALPLAALLDLSLLFPDRAPSRFMVLRRRGRVQDLADLLHSDVPGGSPQAREALVTGLGLVTALTAHDRRTRGHSERVRVFVDMIAEEMRLSDADRDRLRWAALLHDIGKLAVPAAVLNKPGRPDAAEWALLRRHPIEGGRLLASLRDWMGPWATAVEEHHEYFDGSGYPNGLAGERISLGGRIIALADAFETMTAGRPYSRSMTPAAARAELVARAGTQFDPVVCRAFLNISVGRLWRVVGWSAWFGELAVLLPFTKALRNLGPQAASVTVGTLAAVSLATGGVLQVPAASGVESPVAVNGSGATPTTPRPQARPRPRTGGAPQPAPFSEQAPAPSATPPEPSTSPLALPGPALTGPPVPGAQGRGRATAPGQQGQQGPQGQHAPNAPPSPAAPTCSAAGDLLPALAPANPAANEQGPVSGPVHSLEPALSPVPGAPPLVHAANCDAVVRLEL